MIHPLFRLLASKPHLLAQHLGGYVQLASAQAHDTARALQRRLAWSAGAAAGLVSGAMLGGVSMLLVAVVPVADMPAPWLLMVAPGVPLAAGGVCWMLARQQIVPWTLAPMREQLAADAALLEEVDRS